MGLATGNAAAQHRILRGGSLLLLLLSLLMPLRADDPGEARRLLVEDAMARFHLRKANSMIAGLATEAEQQFYACHIHIYKFLATEKQVYLDSLRTHWKPALEVIEALPEQTPRKYSMLAELESKRALVEFLQGNYLSALSHARAARTGIRKSERYHPGQEENLKILGLFNVVFGAVPRKYQWLTSLFGYHGDIQTGIRQLERAAHSATLLPMEARIMVCYVEKNMLSRPEQAIGHLLETKRQYGGSMPLDFFLASAYQSIKANDKALEILQRRQQYADDKEVFFIRYWDYLQAKAYYYQENYPRAQACFKRFLNDQGGSMYRSDAFFRLGMSFTLSGNYQAGKLCFHNLASGSNDNLEEDEYASFMAGQFLQAPPGPAVQALFRARNLYDGGYYDKALDILKRLTTQVNTLSDDERTELYYRYARIYHTLGEAAKARTAYRQCIAQPAVHQKWLQAYAHFFLGDLAREEGNNTIARTHFEDALAYDDYFYQAGLENRCKIALYDLKQ